jgi:hypothetical protein
MEGRVDPGGIVLLVEEREEAESIAEEIRSRGPRVVVRAYPDAVSRAFLATGPA